MKKTVLVLLFVSSFITVFAQKFIDISPVYKKQKFAVLNYKEKPVIEEKVNYYLQLKYLAHLPGKFKEHPYEIIQDKKRYTNPYNYASWRQLVLHPNIICLQINGKKGNKSFEYLEHFDVRTGDFFELDDLLNEKGFKMMDSLIKGRIVKLQNENKIDPNSHVGLNYNLQKDTLAIIFNKLKDTLAIPYRDLNNGFTDYAKNVLFDSQKVLRRKGIANKLLKGEGWYDKGGKYERKLNYSILVLGIKPNGKTRIFRWKDVLKNAEEYTESTVIDGVLKADDYIYDSLSDEKVRAMLSLNLKKQEDNSWVGKLQLGSPSYELTFKEY